jgi:hypothetical protein
MKTESLTGGLIKLRNDLQPHSTNNIDPLLFDYQFHTAVESFAKKEREKSKNKVLALADDPSKKGTIVKGQKLKLVLKTSKAPSTFDLETFIAAILEAYPDVQKHKLRTLASDSTISGSPRKSYTVESMDDE